MPLELLGPIVEPFSVCLEWGLHFYCLQLNKPIFAAHYCLVKFYVVFGCCLNQLLPPIIFDSFNTLDFTVFLKAYRHLIPQIFWYIIHCPTVREVAVWRLQTQQPLRNPAILEGNGLRTTDETRCQVHHPLDLIQLSICITVPRRS